MSMQRYLPLFLMAASLNPAAASVAWKPIYGARGMGMGGATAAIAEDSTATIVNPALLAEQKETRADLGGLTFYRPGEITYRRDADELSPGGYTEQTQTTTTSTIPYGGFVWQPSNDRFAVGFGINVPFADTLTWSKGPGRYFATETTFSFLYVTPAVAYQVTDRLSVGAGIDLVRFDGTIRTKLDFGSIAGQPEEPSLDGNAKLEGDGTGVAYNAGILFHFTKQFKVGLSYLSPVSFTASGVREVTVPDLLQRGLGLPPKISFLDEEMEIKMPAIWRLGASLTPTEHFMIAAEIQLLDRSNEKFLLKNQGSTRPDVLPDSEEPLVPKSFESAYAYKLGGEFTHGKMAFRLGAAVDENGVPDESMSPAGLDTRKVELTAGFGYKLSKLNLDIAWSHVMGDTRHVTNSQVENRLSGRTANGTYELATEIIVLGVGYRF